MTNIIAFPQSRRVEIHYGEIKSAVTIGADGKKSLPEEIGTMRFFVEVMEVDGSRIRMWDGHSYEEAIIQAYDLAADFGPVHDLVTGAA